MLDNPARPIIRLLFGFPTDFLFDKLKGRLPKKMQQKVWSLHLKIFIFASVISVYICPKWPGFWDHLNPQHLPKPRNLSHSPVDPILAQFD